MGRVVWTAVVLAAVFALVYWQAGIFAAALAVVAAALITAAFNFGAGFRR
jgi:hypothetical protein